MKPGKEGRCLFELDGNVADDAASRGNNGGYDWATTMRRGIIALSLAAAVVLVAALPAFAGKGGSSISLVMPNASLTAGAASPHHGDQVTFAVATTATSRPWVDTTCSQNGQVVYEQWAGFFDGYLGSTMFTLGPTQLWTGGAASCTATLVTYDKNGRASALASTSFSVSG